MGEVVLVAERVCAGVIIDVCVLGEGAGGGHVRACVGVRACVHACVRVQVCKCVCARARARACVCLCVHVFLCGNALARTCVLAS